MNTLTYIIFGIILLALLFGLLLLWLWISKQREIKESNNIFQELTVKKTPKLTKEEQFDFVDGNGDWTKIQKILGKNEIPLLVLDYFIDIEPDEYLNHLRKHNPPNYWQEDMYGNAEIKNENGKSYIIYYDHGKKTNKKVFENYDLLLKYLVYQRLTNIGFKYKKSLNKCYYAK